MRGETLVLFIRISFFNYISSTEQTFCVALRIWELIPCKHTKNTEDSVRVWHVVGGGWSGQVGEEGGKVKVKVKVKSKRKRLKVKGKGKGCV